MSEGRPAAMPGALSVPADTRQKMIVHILWKIRSDRKESIWEQDLLTSIARSAAHRQILTSNSRNICAAIAGARSGSVKRRSKNRASVRDQKTALIVELLPQRSSVYKLRRDCATMGIPYLRYYYDHEGWWNTYSYVTERTRAALNG